MGGKTTAALLAMVQALAASKNAVELAALARGAQEAKAESSDHVGVGLLGAAARGA